MRRPFRDAVGRIALAACAHAATLAAIVALTLLPARASGAQQPTPSVTRPAPRGVPQPGTARRDVEAARIRQRSAQLAAAEARGDVDASVAFFAARAVNRSLSHPALTADHSPHPSTTGGSPMRTCATVVAAGLLLGAASCAKQDTDTANRSDTTAATVSTARATSPDDARRAIEQANARFVDAMKRGDTTTIADNYATDAVIMMPNEKAWHGRDEARKGLVGFVTQMTVKDAKVETSGVVVGGDLAVEHGTYEWTLQPKGGRELEDRGKYLTVWQRQADGSWKIIRDINNSDVAAK